MLTKELLLFLIFFGGLGLTITMKEWESLQKATLPIKIARIALLNLPLLLALNLAIIDLIKR